MCFSANKILFIDAKLIQIMMYFIFLQALQIHQFTGKRDFLWFASFSRDIVVLRIDAIEMFHESLLDSGALLVDGILGRVGDVMDTITDVLLHISVGVYDPHPLQDTSTQPASFLQDPERHLLQAALSLSHGSCSSQLFW